MVHVAALLAHQGGWDEFLFVAAPIAVVVGLLKIAGSRARRIQAQRASAPDAPPGSPDAGEISPGR